MGSQGLHASRPCRLRDIGSTDIIALVEPLAPDFHLEPALVLAVIEAESNFIIQGQSPQNIQG
jgi:soluble lytic murein transglycosylase-like protein